MGWALRYQSIKAMNNQFDHELSGPLADLVRSVDEASSTATNAAQERLIRRRQTATRPARSNSRGWLAFAGTTAIVLVVMVTGAMLSGGGVAFAEVQDRFSQFDNMVMTVTQRLKGQMLQSSQCPGRNAYQCQQASQYHCRSETRARIDLITRFTRSDADT